MEKCTSYDEIAIKRKPTAEEREKSEPTFGKWISVKDKLPRHNQLVLIAFDAGKTSVKGEKVIMGYMGRDADEWFEIYTPFNACHWNTVTHWMPLPEPPKESED